jgi:multidrug efflux pump subunit AcrA (membrane-fusion protein)
MKKPSPYQGTVYRQAALDKLRSPERLDALFPLVPSWAWVALTALGFGLATALLWGIFGVVIRTASGEGILLRNSEVGIVEVSVEAAGRLSDIQVRSGDVVHAGEAVAKVELPEMEGQITSIKTVLDSLYKQEAKTPEVQQHIFDQQVRLRELQALYDRESVVRAPTDGKVTEVSAGEGNFVSPGKTILRLESLQGDYEAMVYVPAAEGKKIKPGMSVRLALSTVNPEEFGVLLARVKFVSGYPVTRDYLLNELGGDERLVDKLLERRSMIEMVAVLEETPSTPSGFRWTSPKGPDVSIESGTLCSATVVLNRARPITLLIPWLRVLLGAP